MSDADYGQPVAEHDQPVLDLIASMTAESLSRSTLEADEVWLVRIAALVAMDAPPASYLINIGAADYMGVDAEKLQGVLLAIAPIVGTARVASAASKVVRALGLESALTDEELEGSGG